MNQNEIKLKVLKIRLDSLLKMPSTMYPQSLVKKLRKEITELERIVQSTRNR